MDAQKQLMVTAGSTVAVALDYDRLKTQLKIELTEQVNGFVRIGFLLKQARDTDILAGSEYRDVVDFASKEFHLTKDVVSRYINICEKYSVGGNSDRLLPEYQEYGYSKLSEMLTLPDEIAEEITPDMTRREIQEIKKEYQEEQKVTPLETMVEEPVAIPEEVKEQAGQLGIEHFDTSLGKTLYLLCEKDRKLFDDLLAAAQQAAVAKEACDAEDYAAKASKWTLEAIAPDGQNTMMVRVPQTGKVILSVRDKKVTLTNMRSLEKEEWTPIDIMEAFREMAMAAGGLDQDDDILHDRLFGAVAPVQQQGVETEKAKNDEKSPQNTENAQKLTENDQKLTEMQKNGAEGQEKKTDTAAAQEEAGTAAAQGTEEGSGTAAAQKTPETHISTGRDTDFDQDNAENGENSDLPCQNAASGDSADATGEAENGVILENGTEIIEKPLQKGEGETLETLISTLGEPNLAVEKMEQVVNALIRQNTLRFDDDDPRRRPAGKIPFLMHALIYHVRQWKWAVVESVAKNLASEAARMKEGEDEVYRPEDD